MSDVTAMYMTMSSAARLVPSSRSERGTSPATLYRWAKNGLRGVRLEATQVGGKLCTTEAALERFFAALTRERENRLNLDHMITASDRRRLDAEDRLAQRLLGELD